MGRLFLKTKVSIHIPNGGMYVMVTDERNDYYPNDREWRLLKYNQMPDILPDLERCKTSDGDALPDVIDHYFFNYAPGLFFNERTKEILSSFNLVNHALCPGSIVYKRKKINYYWMHIACNLYEFINFKDSIFGIGNYQNQSVTEQLPEGCFDSFDNFLLKRKSLFSSNETVLPIKLKFNSDFNTDLDLIFIDKVASEIYLSERLVSALQENEITGLTYEESHIFDF